MNAGGIDSSRIQSMLAQLRAAAQKPQTDSLASSVGLNGTQQTQSSTKLDFSQALKTSLEQVSSAQANAEKLGKQFAGGDDSVSLSDVMIAGQKANISLQATIQVRNKLVSAYHDIMNMQV
jgi:flagellar hook-basal body complex protein FliE